MHEKSYSIRILKELHYAITHNLSWADRKAFLWYVKQQMVYALSNLSTITKQYELSDEKQRETDRRRKSRTGENSQVAA